ncbi:MAG: zinc metallopeptidase [Nitrospira sp.]|nr:zinc metallopeptidase [Nitrospira sp.]MDH4327855.1 zinc metallopeptidase [Nitrospira sp.]MDH5253667.1 zinc metallopeptidase [Nitrospira sp.]
MRLALLLIIIGLVIFGPQLWTRRVFAQYSGPRPDYPGTGGELARHLLDRFDMKHITVETTELGDHYDAESKAVRLTPDKFSGKSLTALTVAAHEVGHAIQDHTGYQPLTERARLVRVAQGAERIGAVVMMGIPIATALAKTPTAGMLVLLAGMATIGISTLVHLFTLPVEWDASFRRALPVLQRGNYLSTEDMRGARRILTAAALTYLAASLGSLLNLWRWIGFLRR